MFFDGTKENSDNPTRYIPNDSNYEDKRYLPRWEVCNRILYCKEDEDNLHQGVSQDLHCQGMCIKTKESIELNKKLALTIYLTGNSDPINASGFVVWQKEIDNEHLVGLHFDKLPNKARKLITDYAFEFKKDDVVKNWFKGW